MDTALRRSAARSVLAILAPVLSVCGSSGATAGSSGPLPEGGVDPTTGTTPGQTLHGVSSVPLTLSDHPVVLEIQP
jgi:hypothetical protein